MRFDSRYTLTLKFFTIPLLYSRGDNHDVSRDPKTKYFTPTIYCKYDLLGSEQGWVGEWVVHISIMFDCASRGLCYGRWRYIAEGC